MLELGEVVGVDGVPPELEDCQRDEGNDFDIDTRRDSVVMQTDSAYLRLQAEVKR